MLAYLRLVSSCCLVHFYTKKTLSVTINSILTCVQLMHLHCVYNHHPYHEPLKITHIISTYRLNVKLVCSSLPTIIGHLTKITSSNILLSYLRPIQVHMIKLSSTIYLALFLHFFHLNINSLIL